MNKKNLKDVLLKSLAVLKRIFIKLGINVSLLGLFLFNLPIKFFNQISNIKLLKKIEKKIDNQLIFLKAHKNNLKNKNTREEDTENFEISTELEYAHQRMESTSYARDMNDNLIPAEEYVPLNADDLDFVKMFFIEHLKMLEEKKALTFDKKALLERKKEIINTSFRFQDLNSRENKFLNYSSIEEMLKNKANFMLMYERATSCRKRQVK